jgi:two-component system nitrate/nitrite response regulator NarL
MMTARHLIISGESRLFREGLRRILQGPAITVVGEASCLEIVFGLLNSSALPDLVLCDPSADLDTEFSIMRRIATEFPTVSIIVITNDLRHSSLDCAVESGARGFLPQDLSPAALEMLLKLVLMGENIFPGPQYLQAELRDGIRRAHDRDKALTTPLSQKENEVLECLGNGMPNKLIARNLNIAEATVKVHIKSLMRKINVRNRTQAAIWSVNHRLNSGAGQIATGRQLF